jgi:serpin B
MMKKTIIILIFVFLFSICQGVSIEKQPYEAETITGQKSVVEGNNKFALELYAKLKSAEGNLFFSPYSISTALAMTYAGARERTAGQMADVLHFPTMLEGKLNAEEKNNSMKPEQFHRAFGKIIQNMNARGTKDKYELSVANALWGQEGHEFLDEFLELVKTNYDGGLHEVDFVEASEKARQTINKWVGEKTRYKIKELIKKGVLDSMTRLVLTNAIYFKGNWARQFDEKLTKDSPFYLSELKHVQVPLMNQKGEFGYMEADDFQMLELPYVDDELSMVIVLPKEK